MSEEQEKPETTAEDATPKGEVPADFDEIATREAVITILKSVYDPEIPVDIYELGLIYNVDVSAEAVVDVRFTLTSPNCPAAQSLPEEMELKIKGIPAVQAVNLELTWEPTWTPDMMSDAAKLTMNMM